MFLKGRYTCIACGVDNNPARTATSLFALTHGVPVVYAAVGTDGGSLYCFVQEPGKACFGCAFPQFVNDDRHPCSLPGIICVTQVVAGFIAYAVDTLICNRYRGWNLVSLTMHGDLKPVQETVARNPHCPLCGTP